jgi:hypothetical protein
MKSKFFFFFFFLLKIFSLYRVCIWFWALLFAFFFFFFLNYLLWTRRLVSNMYYVGISQKERKVVVVVFGLS